MIKTQFVIPVTELDEYLQKSGPHKYISKKMVRGKWVYEYKDDVVKRVVDLLLDFLSNPARTVTVGQVARSFRVNSVMAKEVVNTLVAQKKIELVPGERGVPTYRQYVPKETPKDNLDALKLEWAKLGTKALRTMASSPKQKRILKEQKEIEDKIDAIQGKGEGSYYPDSWFKEKPKPVVVEPVKPVEKPKQGKVEPSLWEKQPKFGVAGGPDWYFLTDKGHALAAKVATGLAPSQVEALRDLFALGTIAKIEQHYGAEVRQTPFGEKHGSELSILSAGGYVKMHTGRDRKYSLTEKGNSALIAIDKEEQALLKRVRETDVEKPVEKPMESSKEKAKGTSVYFLNLSDNAQKIVLEMNRRRGVGLSAYHMAQKLGIKESEALEQMKLLESSGFVYAGKKIPRKAPVMQIWRLTDSAIAEINPKDLLDFKPEFKGIRQRLKVRDYIGRKDGPEIEYTGRVKHHSGDSWDHEFVYLEGDKKGEKDWTPQSPKQKVEPPKVLVEPPKKTKKELQKQKKELQREANKIHGAGGQLSLDFTVKLELIDDKINDADINENVEKVVEEVQKPVKEPEPKPIEVDGRPDEEFTREFGEHVWGSKADKWAILTVSDNLAEFPPAEQAKLCTKKRLMTDASLEELLDSGVTPGGVLMRKVVERCVQAKAGDSLRARKAYMDGITFLDRSLAQCITAQDVKDFVQEWHYLSRGYKKFISYTDAEMEVLLVEEGKKRGQIPVEVSTQDYLAKKKAFREAEKAVNKVDQIVFIMIHYDKGSKEKLAEKKAELADLIAKKNEIEKEFDAVGGDRGLRGVYPGNLVEEIHGKGRLVYRTTNTGMTFFERDPNLPLEVKENPYALYAACLGARIARLVGAGTMGQRPKIYRDADSEIHGWNYYLKKRKLTDEEEEEQLFQFLEPKKRGDGKPRFRWKREVSENVERVGGQVVKRAPTVTEFAETFGLPNVQMGNWVKSDIESAKSHLEGAQGALLDLSEIMGIDPKTVGLNGRLSLSFGGRGGGTAKAHYEPSKVIINLTKFAGGGSLAHEWAHAFDNLIPRSHNKKDTSAMPMISDGAHEGIPEKIKDAYNEVMGAIRYAAKDESKAKLLGEGVALERQVLKTRVVSEEYRKKMPLYRQAQKEVEASNYFLDSATVGGSENSYWTRGHEMFARAFEAYIEDTLTEKKRKSSYLASGTQKHYNTGKIRTVEGKQIEAQVYPQGEERKRINKAMAKLVKVLAEEKALEKSLRLLDERFFIKAG